MRRPRVLAFAFACLVAAGWFVTVGVWLSAAAINGGYEGTLSQNFSDGSGQEKGLRSLSLQRSSARTRGTYLRPKNTARALYGTAQHRSAAAEDDQSSKEVETPAAARPPNYASKNQVRALLSRFQSSISDVFLSRAALQLDSPIPCGGHQIMSFRSMEEVRNLSSKLNDYLPAADPVLSMSLKEATCAVVGNSGSLRASGCGKTIDSFEHIIRFNAAPTKGFEDDVGYRTGLRILNVDSLAYREKQDQYRAFTIRTKQDAFRYLNFMRKSSTQTYLFHPNFWCEIWDLMGDQGLKPSTGLAGVALALKYCRLPVHLFGFNLDAPAYHYYNNISTAAVSAAFQYHPFDAEAKLYRSLEALGLLVLEHGGTETTC